MFNFIWSYWTISKAATPAYVPTFSVREPLLLCILASNSIVICLYCIYSNICVMLYFWRKDLDSWVAKSCGFMPMWLISSKNSRHQGLSEILLLAALLVCFHIFLGELMAALRESWGRTPGSECLFSPELRPMLSLHLLTFISSLSL